jgi:chromosome segregation ATPase
MELDKDNMIDFVKPIKYKEKKIEFNQKINFLLNDFKDKYVASKMYSEDEETQNNFQNIVSNIQQLQNNLVTTSREIQETTNQLNESMMKFNLSIQQEKKINKELKRKLGVVESKNNSASEMIDDYRDMYDISYLRNWSLILSSIACIYTIHIVYKN